jgi:hypothetical protein
VFDLSDFLALPADAKEEADIEGLDIDAGWLWLVGSHSVKRKKPKQSDGEAGVATKLGTSSRDGNRHLLARVPLEGKTPTRDSGSRRAGTIPSSPESSALLDAVVQSGDPHLKPFVDIPGKDNGLDIEGLAVRGMQAFVGLRGPVLREWCCILRLQIEADERDGALRLSPVEGPIHYRKHFLKLGGLGVRDLVSLDDDLLILVGPAMAHDGPIEIWRWRNATKAGGSSPSTEATRLLALPHGEGTDRAEGLTVFEQGAGSTRVLVVYDSPAAQRVVGESSVRADVFRLP